MLFLTFGNFFMLCIRFLSQTVRYRNYARIMQRLLPTASIVVQRTKNIQAKKILKTCLLNLEESSEKLEHEDDYLQISSVQPVQEVDLSTWTAYTPYLEAHNAAVAGPDQNICILMDARRPIDLKKFVKDSLRVPPAYRVHVLSLCCPIAWKTAEPFGIILHCSFSGLVSLSDAFGQGTLTLDEDLELTGFATVKTVGTPKKLVPQTEKLFSVKEKQKLEEPKLFSGKEGSDNVDEGKLKSQNNTQSHEKQSSTCHVTEKSNSFLNKHQDLRFQPVISSSDNIEVDHTETFIVNPPEEIYVKKSDKQTTQMLTSNEERIQDKSLLNMNKGSQGGSHMKPPNILIYCGIKDSARKFAEVRSSLESCINTEAYTIYHLKHESVLSTPWRSNATLLVVSSCTHLRQDVEDEIEKFVLKDGGTLLSFNSSVDSAFVEKLEEDGSDGEKLVSFKFKDGEYITSVRGRFFYIGKQNVQVIVPYDLSEPQQTEGGNNLNQEVGNYKAGNSRNYVRNRALVVKVQPEGGGVVVLSQLLLERDPTEHARDQETFAALKHSNTSRLTLLRDILDSLGIDTSSGTSPALTPCFLLAQRVGLTESFLESFKHRLKSNTLKSQKLSLKFEQSPNQTAATSTLLPVITYSDFDVLTEYFSPQIYWKNLKTLKLGQILFYTDVITSTMPVFDGLQFSVPDDMGLIAIAGRQTSGRGRGGNSWLSPAGCAMFTLPLTIDLNSQLGQRVSFLQHIISLAVVQSVLTLPGYENLDIKLKWPNDIYFGKEMKLGGILVTSTIVDTTIYATIGCGFNVSNSNPTICINDIIRLRNISNPQLPELSPLNSSQLIARTVTCLENLLQNFEKDGHLAFCSQYYKHWLHGNAKVHIQLDKPTEGVIVGLDDYGFLSVHTQDGVISVQPDGNSFDMMHNLIHTKPRS